MDDIMAYSVIKNGDSYNHGALHREYLLDSIEDISNLPTNCAPGSIARITNGSYVYVLSNSGAWVESIRTEDWGKI